MWPVSARFMDAVRVSQVRDVYVELYMEGVKQTFTDGTDRIKPIAGSVSLDENNNVRAQCSFSFVDKYLVPVQASDLLDPVITDVRPYIGIAFTEGFVEYIPLGVFRVSKAGVSKHNDVISVTSDDYSRVLADDRFVTWNTPAGSLVTDEIRRIALDSVSTLTVIDLTGSTRRTTDTTWDKERWQAIEKLAASIDAEVYFDRLGQLIIRPVPQLISGSVAVWEVNADADDAVLVDYETSYSSDEVYNGVYVTSSAPDTNVSAFVWQSTGKYRWRSGFRRTRMYSSPLLTTYDQCVSAGWSILSRSLTAARVIQPTILPNPALDIGDIVNITLPAAPDGNQFEELRVITKMTIPFGNDTMDLGTRTSVDLEATEDAGSFS